MKVSSTIGIVNMERKISLSATDICRIIKQCHVSGVQEFAFEGMSFKFHPRRNGDADQLGQASDYAEKSDNVVSSFSEAKDQAQLMDEDAMFEAEEAQLLIDDPLAFEKLQMDRHIERARTMNEKA